MIYYLIGIKIIKYIKGKNLILNVKIFKKESITLLEEKLLKKIERRSN